MNNTNPDREVAECLILKEAVENTNEAFVTISEDHKVILFNHAAEKIFGYNRDEVLGRDLNTLLAPQCSHDHRKAVAEYVRTKKAKLIGHETEFTATRKDGETFPASISFSVASIKGELFFTALVRDMTATKELQEKVREAERLAALGQVVAEITHEIRNPVMLIGGFAQRLGKEIKTDTAISKLHVIIDEVQRLEHLLKELQEFYMPKALRLEQLDINDLLGDIHDLVKDECEKRGIRTLLVLGTDVGFIKGDREKLKQVLLNLTKNAIEAMETGGNLSLRTVAAGGKIHVVVADDGPGIAEHDQTRIFTPFFTTKGKGSGLGLCISKRIVEAHPDSMLDLTSFEGKGTEVTITLPLCRVSDKEWIESQTFHNEGVPDNG